MPKYKIHHRDYFEPKFPDICPHCLEPGADQYIQVKKTQIIPFVISVTTTQPWPICERCSTFRSSLAKIRSKVFAIALLLTVITFSTTTSLTLFSDILPPEFFVWGFYGVGIVVILAPIYLHLEKNKAARAAGLPFAHMPIYLIKRSKQLLREGYSLQFLCYHAEYALAYEQANEYNGEVQIKPDPGVPVVDE